MTHHYGATPEEWALWDLTLGLTADLLPVVCKPGCLIAPTSKLKSYGKVPSQYDGNGHVVGLANWTSRVSTSAQIDRWSAEPDYGICLQTRRVRALDVDVTDAIMAEEIWACLNELQFPGDIYSNPFRWPKRTRADSHKFLTLLGLPGNYPKQTLQTAHGVIEFLGNGQQCLVAGTHKDGARYEWSVPVIGNTLQLNEEDFARVKSELHTWFGMDQWSEGRAHTPRGAQASVDLNLIDDPALDYLRRNGLILSSSKDGRAHVACPWAESHTQGSDETATTYFPAGTGQYEQGHFLCLHAHCAERTTGQFLDAVGYLTDGFEVIGAHDDAREVLEGFGIESGEDYQDLLGGLEVTKKTVSPVEGPRFERELKSGKIYARLKNVVTALLHPDPYTMMPLAKDAYTDQLLVQEGTTRRLFTDTDYTELALRLHESAFMPIPSQMMREAVQYAAKHNLFDSAIDWLNGLPEWDGIPRIERFCEHYLGAEPSAYAKAVSLYWWTAHAGRVLVPGIQADMAIVLISGQGTGKTSAVKAMVPGSSHYVELSLDYQDDDLARSMRGRMIGEIAELRGLNGRDKESIKAWVSKQEETWVPKYMEFPHTFPRRLVLVGTSNQDEFLVDETGNRRWLPIKVGAFQDREKITRDRDQLWAEAKSVFVKKGILWKQAETLARAEHYQFEIHDPWEEPIRAWFARPDLGGLTPLERGYIRMDEVLQDALSLDVNRIHMAEQFRVGKILKQMGLQRGNKRTERGIQKIWVFK